MRIGLFHAYWRFTLCGGILLVALVVWLGWQASIVAERKAVKALLRERNIGMDGLPTFTRNDPTLPWYRLAMGDDTIGGIYLNSSEFSNSEICRILNVYPEVDFAILDATGQEVAPGGHDVPHRTAPFARADPG